MSISLNISISIVFMITPQVFAQNTNTPISRDKLNQELHQLISMYSGIESSTLERRSTTDPDVRSHSLVFKNGEFVTKFWRAREENGEQLFSLTHATTQMLRNTFGPPRYVENETPPEYFNPPGPVHLWENPWPMLQEWCLALDNDSKTVATTVNGGMVIQNDALGLSLTFSPSRECRIVEVQRDTLKTRMEFSVFETKSAEGWPVPGQLRRVFILDANDPSKTRIDEWKITSLKFNSQDKEETLTWDPDELGVYRYEPSSGNVYAGDGSLMYNETEYAERALGMAGVGKVTRRWLVPGLICLALASGALAYWRSRR